MGAMLILGYNEIVGILPTPNMTPVLQIWHIFHHRVINMLTLHYRRDNYTTQECVHNIACCT